MTNLAAWGPGQVAEEFMEEAEGWVPFAQRFCPQLGASIGIHIRLFMLAKDHGRRHSSRAAF
jgi:hypothetical protein